MEAENVFGKTVSKSQERVFTSFLFAVEVYCAPEREGEILPTNKGHRLARMRKFRHEIERDREREKRIRERSFSFFGNDNIHETVNDNVVELCL